MYLKFAFLLVAAKLISRQHLIDVCNCGRSSVYSSFSLSWRDW